jgi:hypothetical protein
MHDFVPYPYYAAGRLVMTQHTAPSRRGKMTNAGNCRAFGRALGLILVAGLLMTNTHRSLRLRGTKQEAIRMHTGSRTAPPSGFTMMGTGRFAGDDLVIGRYKRKTTGQKGIAWEETSDGISFLLI